MTSTHVSAQVKSFQLANCEIYVKLKFVEQKQIQRIQTIECLPINIKLFLQCPILTLVHFIYLI